MDDLCARTRADVRMIRGHCLHHLAQIPDASIDAIVTDPPYGIDLKLRSNRKRPATIRGDGLAHARRLWAEFLPHAARVARPDTAHLFFGTWKSIWIAELLARHFAVKGCIVWYKNTWGYGWYIRPRWELAWYCHKGTPPIPAKAPPDVWEFKRDHRLLHPCQKPVDLLRAAIRFVAPRGGHILDPFAGIGSTGVAAVQEGCSFTGTLRALEALSRVGLGEVWTYLRTPHQLSEGQRWRLKLALAIEQLAPSHNGQSAIGIRQSPLLIADEFTSLLDRLTAHILSRSLRKSLNARPHLHALLATSHEDLSHALQPDRIIHCDFGRVEIRIPKPESRNKSQAGKVKMIEAAK